MKHVSPFSLIKEKRFGPLFFTQFFGAFNDNLYKQAIVIFVSIAVTRGQIDHFLGKNINTVAGALIILPFFLFSSIAGQLSDKYDKAHIMRITKLGEVLIMTCAAIAFYLESPYLMLVILFLMGTQSTFFGPSKYSILPQSLTTKQELVRGNALIEMGTYIGILTGGTIGSIVVAQNYGNYWAAFTVLTVSLIGLTASYFIPAAPPAAGNDIKLNWNLYSESKRIIKMSHRNPVVFLSILGVSWFWFYGSVFVSQAVYYNKEVLNT